MLEADQPVVAHPRRVEPHLHLDVFGGGAERAGELPRKAGIGRLRRVEHIVASVALSGERLKNGVIESIGSDTARIKRDALLAQRFDRRRELGGIGIAEIGGAIGQEDNAVLRLGIEIAPGEFTAELERFLDVRAALGGGPGNDVQNLAGLVTRHLLGEQARLAGEADQRQAIVRSEQRHQNLHRAPHRRRAVFALHGPGGVEQNRQAQRLTRAAARRRHAHRDPHQVALLENWMGRLLDPARDLLRRRGSRIAVVEGVVEFLGPDGGGIGHFAAGQRGLGEAEGDVAHMEGERGDRILGGADLGGDFSGRHRPGRELRQFCVLEGLLFRALRGLLLFSRFSYFGSVGSWFSSAP